MIMKASSETYSGKEEPTELDLELGRILLRIHRKWQQSGQDEEFRAKAAVPPEEMETVIIPSGSEAVQPAPWVAEEFTETVILAPLAHGTQAGATTESDEEALETMIIAPGITQETPTADGMNEVEEETVVLRGNETRTGHPILNDEDSLDETIVLPPRKQRAQRKGTRQ